MPLVMKAALTSVPRTANQGPLPYPAAALASGPGTNYGGSPGTSSDANGFVARAGRLVPLLGVSCLLATRGSGRGARGTAGPRKAAAAGAPTGAIEIAEAEGAVAPAEPGQAKGFNVLREVGVCDPFGKPGQYIWDPLKLSTNVSEETFRWYRQAELKHGRVSMLAIAGLLNQHYWRFEGLELGSFEGGLGLSPNSFESVPNGFAAVTDAAGPYLGALVIVAGIVELRTSDEGREPGNFGDPAGIVGSNTNGFVLRYDEEWRNFELNHGRLAMFGIIGALAAEYVTGLDTFGQWAEVFTPR